MYNADCSGIERDMQTKHSLSFVKEKYNKTAAPSTGNS
jgi:hypothetical protein